MDELGLNKLDLGFELENLLEENFSRLEIPQEYFIDFLNNDFFEDHKLNKRRRVRAPFMGYYHEEFMHEAYFSGKTIYCITSLELSEISWKVSIRQETKKSFFYNLNIT